MNLVVLHSLQIGHDPIRSIVSIQCLERGAPNSCMMTCIVPEFRQRQPAVPFLGMIMGGTTKIHFNALIYSLGLTIGLGMIGSAHVEMCVKLLKQFRPKFACKIGSRSDAIVAGIPCRRTMLCRNALATTDAENGCFSGTKCANFVYLSTTTMITSYPSLFSKPVMKSIVRSRHGPVGRGSGCKSPGGLQSSCFACWQIEHRLTKSSTACF